MAARAIESSDTHVTRALVRVDFHGDVLEAVREGDVTWVSVRRICDALGLQFQAQSTKLKAKEWAGVTMIVTPSDGGHQSMLCIPERAVPMWMATIDAERVRPDYRKKLIHYQTKVAEFLAGIFIDGEQVGGGVTQEQFAMVVGELRALRAANDAMAAKMLQMAQHAGSITGLQMDWIRLQVVEIAHMRCALAKNPHLRSARMAVENRVNAAAQWGGRGQKRRDMPADRYPLVKACLASHRADLEAELKQRKTARRTIDATVRAEQQNLFAKKTDDKN